MKNEKNLRYFLFEENLEHYKKTGFDISTMILSNYKAKYLKLYKNPLIKLALKCFRANHLILSPILIKKNEKIILFQNPLTRYTSIINKTSKKNAIILGIKTSAIKDIISKRTMYYPVFDNVYLDLYLGIIYKNNEKIYKSLDKLRNTFEYLNPDLLILNDDFLPPSRAMVLVSKELGIPSIEIQHGAYSSNNIPTGIYSDYVFVWGKYFRDIYLDKKIRPRKTIKVLGYPYELGKIRPNNKINPKYVYYLSEDYEHYNKDSIDVKIETLSKLNDLCNDLGLNFIYRPHPEEDIITLKSELKNIKFSPKRETLLNCFKKGNIFISFNSSSLIEAALHSKICIQLKYYPFQTDDFEKLGICPSFDNIDKMRLYLRMLSKTNDLSYFQKKVDNSYIEIPSPDPSTRFLELIDDIMG